MWLLGRSQGSDRFDGQGISFYRLFALLYKTQTPSIASRAYQKSFGKIQALCTILGIKMVQLGASSSRDGWIWPRGSASPACVTARVFLLSYQKPFCLCWGDLDLIGLFHKNFDLCMLLFASDACIFPGHCGMLWNRFYAFDAFRSRFRISRYYAERVGSTLTPRSWRALLVLPANSPLMRLDGVALVRWPRTFKGRWHEVRTWSEFTLIRLRVQGSSIGFFELSRRTKEHFRLMYFKMSSGPIKSVPRARLL